MERLKTFSKALLLAFLVRTLWATEIGDRYSYINTFKDDRQIVHLNQNFQRLTRVISDDGDFNAVFKGTSNVVLLNQAQTDADYGVLVYTSWHSTFSVAVIDKTTTSFKVETSTPGHIDGGTIDWLLVR